MKKTLGLTRRKVLLLGLSAVTGMGAVTVAGKVKSSWSDRISLEKDQRRDFTVLGDAPLRDRAATKGILYGAATPYNALSSDPEFAAAFARECSIVVPESVLKWDIVRPDINTFNFTPGDWIAEFARQHDMQFRGHTLVWHTALPAWFKEKVNRENAQQIMIDHITKVMKHYAGKAHSWDVVNEAIRIDDGRSDGLRNTPWLEFLGTDYIRKAFEAAAAADPQALLVYNEYGLDYGTRDDDAKRTAVLKLLENLKNNNVPVHALGIQAHLRKDDRHFDAQKLRNFLRDVASLGLKILITELDVKDNNLPFDIQVRDRAVAGVYQDYLSVVLEEPAVIAVLTWGLSDRYTWLSHQQPRADDAPVRPLPLDSNFNRKLAWNAIARAFDRA